ncbi:MAG TPA: NAD(P)-dependent oxidoreductase [Thermoplasmata archaeon]|nr:NAD(P)-dependent oxidoreductase [Thermoplasmata archaeon]
MVRIGVTGATGFIGGALVPYLAARGFELRLVDDRSGPIHVEYSEWPALAADFAGESALRALSDCDVILHLAAVSGVMPCARDPSGTARVNVDGTRRLYAMCKDRRIPVAFASSFAVVGAPEQLPVREGTPARPTHEYARQKAIGETLTAELAATAHIAAANLRQSNVYGGYVAAGRRVSKGNVLEVFARQAQEGRLLVNAPGTQRRDFVHIEDVLAHWEAAVRFLTRPSVPPTATTFNVASGEAISVLEMAERVVHAYTRLHPERPALRVEVVRNPREGVELVEPAFAVDRSHTEHVLGVACRHRVDGELPEILRSAELSSPSG